MIQAVERAVRILNCFEEQELLGITEIAEKTNLNKSTAFGLVTTLTETGLLEHDSATNRYRLGLALFRLGKRVNADLQRLVMPAMDALVEQLEETVNFVRPSGGDVIYIVKKESPHSMRICTKIGQRLPMYCTAVGKALLSAMPEAEAEAVIGGYTFTPYTERTVCSAETLREEIALIRKNGYAVEREELEYGLVCVAVPVPDKLGRASAAISCSGPKMRMTDEKIEACWKALQLQAKLLAQIIY